MNHPRSKLSASSSSLSSNSLLHFVLQISIQSCGRYLTSRKNGVNQLRDADHVSVQVHGETGQIDAGQLGAMPGQLRPSRVGLQIDRAPLFIAIAEAAQAAQQIAQMREGKQR